MKDNKKDPQTGESKPGGFLGLLKQKLKGAIDAVGISKWSLKKRIVAISLAGVFLLTCACVAIILLLPSEEQCSSHVDVNEDLICDVCGAELEAEPEAECTEHVDSDGDLICDACGAELEASEPEPDPEPECEHKDTDLNGKCELCGDMISEALLLVSNGSSSFSFVFGQSLNGDAKMTLDNLAKDLKKRGVTIPVYSEGDQPESEYEILVGGVSSRGAEYDLDHHAFGIKGYTVSVIGNKIVVLGGSNEALIQALGVLRGEFFGITDTVRRITERAVYSSQSLTVKQSDYKVDSITLFGDDIREFKIAIDSKKTDLKLIAKRLQSLLYEKCGYWLQIVEPSEVSGGAVYLDLVEKCGEGGFEAEFAEQRISFVSEYVTSLERWMIAFFEDAIDKAVGTVSFDGSHSFKKNVHYVCYEDFGAVGDGVTNDAEAILAAHNFAASDGYKKIVGTSGKTYYIGSMSATAPISCNVDWTGVKFIVDDKVITTADRGRPLFGVYGISSRSFTPHNSAAIKAINESGGIKNNNVTKIDLGLGYPAMLIVYNKSHMNYIREGVNANGGTYQSEVILVDAEGNIDPSTPFMLDYKEITDIDAYGIGAPGVEIVGGEFTTIAAEGSGYCSRGIYISRSNSTLRGITHYVTGEPNPAEKKGAAYSYFTDVSYAYNVLIEDVTYTAHRTYKNEKGVGQGTYELTVHYASNVTFRNCTQTNFFTASGAKNTSVWGVMGGGHYKNVTYDGCLLNRYDAHSGVLNATIINSTVGNISVVGGGVLRVENTVIYDVVTVRFREDYGAFWHGDVILKNVTMNSDRGFYIFDTSWVNHNFGYQTAMPTNIIIDGFYVAGTTKKAVLFQNGFVNNSYKYDMTEFVSEDAVTGDVTVTPNKNIMTPPKTITVKNLGEGFSIVLPSAEGYFKDTVITVE